MIQEKMYKQVQSFKRRGRSKRQIAACLGMDPKTVAKYYHMDEREFKSYRQRHMFREKLLEEYEENILEVYEINEFKRLNMSAVYDYLEERHGSLPGNEQTLRNYINYLIQTDKLRLEERLRSYSKVPELPFGQQMQLDFGQYRCRSGLKLYIFAGVLSSSRYKYVAFQGAPFTTRDVIGHLLECFDFFGGMPEELVIDQDRLLVVSENAGDIVYTADFRYFIEEQELRMYVCRKEDPETKGKIENLIKYVKCNFLSIRNFKLLEEANSSVGKWLARRANGKISQATKQIPAILIENERQHLRPVRNSIYRKGSLIGREERQVNEKAVISVNASSYQLPPKYRNKTVEIYITRHKLFVFDLYTGKEIVDYDLSLIPGQMVTKREFRRESEKTLEELKDHVTGMFAGSSWKLFTALNFQAFPRYIRDQCVEAKRYFEGRAADLFVLDRALEYCLENNTLSFAELNDTYVHFKREHERADLEMPAAGSGYQGTHEPLRVRARGLSVYKEIINSRGTINESL